MFAVHAKPLIKGVTSPDLPKRANPHNYTDYCNYKKDSLRKYLSTLLGISIINLFNTPSAFCRVDHNWEKGFVMPENDTGTARPTNQSILGLQTEGLAGLTESDLVSNSTAIRMLLHYYTQLLEQNAGLKNNNNTLQTYATAYEKKKSDSGTAAILLLASNLLVGFGINFLTPNVTVPGIVLLVLGVFFALLGIFFNFIKEKI